MKYPKEMTKTYQKDGRWVKKTSRSEIFICPCGNRYLKTRPRQKVCLRCIGRGL